jgi:hypothetical protein
LRGKWRTRTTRWRYFRRGRGTKIADTGSRVIGGRHSGVVAAPFALPTEPTVRKPSHSCVSTSSVGELYPTVVNSLRIQYYVSRVYFVSTALRGIAKDPTNNSVSTTVQKVGVRTRSNNERSECHNGGVTISNPLP